MQNKGVLTYIYHDFWGTDEFKKSCSRFELSIRNAWPLALMFNGHANTIRFLYDTMVDMSIDHQYIIYADAADSLFVKDFEVPEDYLLFSTEKGIWPPTKEMRDLWNEYHKIYPTDSPWKYLNGGGWCGPAKLAIEFYRKYELTKHVGDINGQRELSIALSQACADGFPIKLDYQCNIFQTTGFEHPLDFDIDELGFKNLITGTRPCILHGNGRTEMTRWYKHFNK